MITIVDYGVGNIQAFANMFKIIGLAYKRATTVEELKGASKIILPGVGSFDHAMSSLEKSGMRETLDEFVLLKKIPVIGICVGMQMLAETSEEGKLSGLGWIKGHVKKFDSECVVNGQLPHMGWNSLDIIKSSPLLAHLPDTPRFYFLHSYYFECEKNENILAEADYGVRFSAIVNNGNIFGIQCHPEKSHSNGIQLLKNFGEL